VTSILFNITHGFQARMLLRSSTAEHLLASGTQLIIVKPDAPEEYFLREFDHPQMTVVEMPYRASRLEGHLITLRQYLLMNPSLGGTLNFKNEVFRRQAPKRYYMARTGNLILGNVAPLRRAYLAAENKIFPGSEFDALLRQYQPDLVVTATPGYVPQDIHLLRSAKRLRIPSATVMLSWDNLTSKGYMGVVPDNLLVWSDLMAREAVKYHDFPADKIEWCGAAQFDHYHGWRERFDRLAWRRSHGIADDTPLIVYGTINPALLPHEVNILRSIVKAMRQNRFHRKPYLWVRLHPQVVKGQYSQSLAPFQELAADDVHIEEPAVQSSALAWDLPKEDAEHLANLMVAADIVVTPNSTFSIDAACAGTPIINTFFDGDEPFTKELTAKRFMHYTHYKQILETGGIAKAMSIDDFVQMTDAYAENPELHAAEREAILRQQFNSLDGQAGRRTAELLAQLASSREGRRPALAPSA
jgi:hypothetical protein